MNSLPTGSKLQSIVKDVWIVICMDGTWSSDYQTENNTSSVKRFYLDTNIIGGGAKRYIPGPSGMRGGVTGYGIEAKAERALRFIRKAQKTLTNPRLALIGHSRGCVGCILVAQALQHTKEVVEFLGMYDAVNMTPDVATESIPDNVLVARHAVRSKRVGSRTSWGNTATRYTTSTAYSQSEFEGTHGAVGGAVPEACTTAHVFTFGSCDIEVTADQNRLATQAADVYIRQGARLAGVPVA